MVWKVAGLHSDLCVATRGWQSALPDRPQQRIDTSAPNYGSRLRRWATSHSLMSHFPVPDSDCVNVCGGMESAQLYCV